MGNIINKFAIEGLFGYKNIEIIFNNNVMIVIGENGFGKTSILNALTFTLKGNWKKLSSINFDNIKISVTDKEFSFSHKIVSDYCEYVDHMRNEDGRDVTDFVKANIKETDFVRLCACVAEGKKKEYHNMVFNNAILKSIPESILYNSLLARLERERTFGVLHEIENIVKVLGCEILYLPTYRRVEVGLESLQLPSRKSLHPRFDDDRMTNSEWNNALIRFGMEDVQSMMDNITQTISQSFVAGYAETSGDMIRQLLHGDKNRKHKFNCDKHQMQVILARSGKNLSADEKSHILDMVEQQSEELLNNKYLVYFLEQLLTIYKKQEKYDSAIKQFCMVCNKYLNEKEFYFDESNVTLKIYRKLDETSNHTDDNEVKLSQLSSGEKQIVSIFSQVILNVDKRFIVLLDEPELSLSIFWQENLIPDLIDSHKCDFIMAVTHSPFIFGETLKKYTVGINEFLQVHNHGNDR